MRIPFISIAAAGALALGGCAYGDFGYGGVSVGYGDYGYGPYGYANPYYGAGYGYDYGSPYFGWYDDYYYPGTGVYVYDSYRRPHMWNDRQRSYWTSRRQTVTTTAGSHTLRTNWSGFDRRTASDNRQYHRTH
jgi:hypothetical protein